jgi:hypothetical protein
MGDSTVTKETERTPEAVIYRELVSRSAEPRYAWDFADQVLRALKLAGFSVEDELAIEPPHDEDHYLHHTPAGPNPPCPNCTWLNWSQL